ncbi:MAG: ribokinase [Candidatus Tectomicrobia bacterium]|nr:ribokinase [Candidatus Tectomicrobia bacterium]
MSGAACDLLVIGSMNVDLTTTTDRLPRAGETVLGKESLLSFGGKGANQAVAAARLGSRVVLAGKVGRDLLGRQVLAHLRRSGVDVAAARQTDDAPTGLATIIVGPAGENRIIVAPGANAAMLPADLAPLKPLMAGAGALLLQLELPLETVAAAVAMARDLGTRVILNPAPGRPLPRDLLGGVWCLIPNRLELGMLTPPRPLPPRRGGRDAMVRAAQGLLAWAEAPAATPGQADGCRQVIVTLGRQGCLWVSREGAWRWPAQRADVVDTTGAGDAFVGSFAHGVAQGLALPEAITQATLYAALATERLGAQASYLTAAAFRRALRRRLARTSPRRCG